MKASQSSGMRPSSRHSSMGNFDVQTNFVPKDVVITPLARSAPIIRPAKPATPTRPPDDFGLEDLDEVVLEEYLSESRLRELANTYDLNIVRFLEIFVDTTFNSLGRFGDYVPNLKELKLNNSKISSLRHLGTSLIRLEVLWLSRCEVADLEGVLSIPNLKELYLSFNKISDLSPLSGLDQLQLLDLEGVHLQNFETFGRILATAGCSELNTLTLEGNPISQIPFYRTIVCRSIPTLETLDDIEVTSADKAEGNAEEESEIKEVMEKYAKDEQEEQSIESITKNFTFIESAMESSIFNNAPSDRPNTSGRPTTAGRPSTSLANRPSSSAGRPRTSAAFSTEIERGSGMEPYDAQPYVVSTRALIEGLSLQALPNSLAVEDDASSNLTHGIEDVFCGNPVMALRNRKSVSRTSIQSPNSFPDSFRSKLDSFELSYGSSPPMSALSSPGSQRPSLSRSSRSDIPLALRPESRGKSRPGSQGKSRPTSSGTESSTEQEAGMRTKETFQPTAPNAAPKATRPKSRDRLLIPRKPEANVS